MVVGQIIIVDGCRADNHRRCSFSAIFYVDKAPRRLEPGRVYYPDDLEKHPYILSLNSNEIMGIELRVGTAEMGACSCADVYHDSDQCYACAHDHHESCNGGDPTIWGLYKNCYCECEG